VFLREDIFEVLPINDMNKLREDCGSLLKWDKDSLFRLLLMRINYFAKLKDIPEYTDIDTLFEKTEMRQRTKPSSYLLKRSMMRPRDLICLFDRIINITRDIAKDPFTDAPLELQTLPVNSIYNAESGYSDWLKKELIDEWAVQYPSIKKLLDAVQNHGLTNFTKYELRASIQKSDSAPTDSELSNFIRFLFDNSIVGFRIGGSSLWKYKCFYPSQGFIEAEDYKMHDGLIRGLNLKEPRGREPGKDTAGAE
jgi:hypothetical protein